MNIKVNVVKNADKKDEVVIQADAQGLKYLVDALQKISGKDGPGGHFHLEWQFNNLIKGSAPMTLQHTSNPSDFRISGG